MCKTQRIAHIFQQQQKKTNFERLCKSKKNILRTFLKLDFVCKMNFFNNNKDLQLDFFAVRFFLHLEFFTV